MKIVKSVVLAMYLCSSTAWSVPVMNYVIEAKLRAIKKLRQLATEVSENPNFPVAEIKLTLDTLCEAYPDIITNEALDSYSDASDERLVSASKIFALTDIMPKCAGQLFEAYYYGSPAYMQTLVPGNLIADETEQRLLRLLQLPGGYGLGDNDEVSEYAMKSVMRLMAARIVKDELVIELLGQIAGSYERHAIFWKVVSKANRGYTNKDAKLWLRELSRPQLGLIAGWRPESAKEQSFQMKLEIGTGFSLMVLVEQAKQVLAEPEPKAAGVGGKNPSLLGRFLQHCNALLGG